MEIISSKPVKAGERYDCHIPHSQPMRGKPGPQGEAATIEIVDVVTVEPTDPARVENLGDASNAKFVMYIPKGDQGNAGRDGAPGEPGDDYVLTPEDKKEIAELIKMPEGEGVTGGYYTPEVTQVDADTMAISFAASSENMPQVESVNITLPAGPQGEKGDTGAQGIQGEKGEKGDTGEKGDKGDPGSNYVLTEADKQEIADMAIIVSPEQPEETGVFWYDPDDEESEDGGTTELQPLTFTGAVEATYDGTEAVSVEIPSGGSSAWTFLADVTTTEEVAYAAVEITEDVSELYVYTTIPGNSEGLTNNLYAKAWSAAKSLSGYAGEVHVGALGTTTYYYKTTFRKLGEKTDAGLNIKFIYNVNSTGQSYGGKWGDVNGNYFVLSTQYGNDHLPIGTNIIIYGR